MPRSRAQALAWTGLWAFVAVASAVAAEELPRGTLADMARSAAASFRPLTGDDLQAARGELQQAIARLEQRLAREGENGQAWREYLELDELKEQAGADAPDLDQLDELLTRYQAGHRGLELGLFLDVRESLQRFLTVQGVLETPGMAEQFTALMQQLADMLQRHAEAPSEETALNIGGTVGWLEETRQAPALVAAIRREFQQPNFFAQLSEEFVAAGMEDDVNRDEDIRECILETAIFGKGDVVGRIGAQLLPSDETALIELVVRTCTYSRTVGYNGPVRIYSLGQTGIVATKQLVLDAGGLQSRPAVSRARTNSQTIDIKAKRGSRLVEWIAWRQARKLKGQADYIAARRAERKSNRRTDEEAQEKVADADQQYEQKLRVPLQARRLFPTDLHFRTSDSTLFVAGTHARAAQLAAAGPPPAVAGQPALAIRFHESLAANVAANMLAGRTVRAEDLRQLALDATGRIPPSLQTEDGEENWAITLDSQQPVSMQFDGGSFYILIRATRFYRDDASYEGMNVGVRYRIQPSAAGFQAVRQGDVDVFPPGFEPGSGRPIPPRLQAARTVMLARFRKVFPETMDFTGFDPPGEWARFGHLRPVQWVAEDQWMMLAWEKDPASQAAPQPAATLAGVTP